MRAVITGAATGIGRATAFALNADSKARTGKPAGLILVDIAAEALEETAREVRAAGATVEAITADLSDPAACDAVMPTAQRVLGGLDALVSNAGIIRRTTLLEMSLEEYERYFAINTRPTWLLAKGAYPMLKEAGGSIVAVASVAAHTPYPSLGAYSATKAALHMLVRQMAFDWGRDGIRANLISPGSTHSNIGQNAGQPRPEGTRRGNNPLGRIADPEDQAAAIAFLVSPAARQINGADIAVDGGALTQMVSAMAMETR
jgi:NAD(P)-dependent dehydrogenase (short-subunit alcohol dehydrogenase family)